MGYPAGEVVFGLVGVAGEDAGFGGPAAQGGAQGREQALVEALQLAQALRDGEVGPMGEQGFFHRGGRGEELNGGPGHVQSYGWPDYFRAGRAPITNTNVPPFTTSCCARNGSASRCPLSVADCT